MGDPDGKLAFGGRLEFERRGRGRSSSALRAIWAATAASRLSEELHRATSERSYGVDAQWDHGGLRIQGELIGNDHHYLASSRAISSEGFIPNGRQWGGYALAGYRFDRYWNVMPFTMVEYIQPIDDSLYDDITGYSAGLNFRPSSNVILKVMYDYAISRGDGLLGNVGIQVFTSQIAWVF